MGRLFDMMWRAFVATFEAVRGWLQRLSWDPRSWDGLTWLLLIALLVVLILLILKPRRSLRERPSGPPDLVISLGEIRPLEIAPDGSQAYGLRMNVSNLNPYPVQLLELEVITELTPGPRTADVPALLAAHEAVEVEVRLGELAGDSGTVQLFFYAGQARRKTFYLRSRLLWEPWNNRYKIAPLDQRVVPARRLASNRLEQLRLEAWRQEKIEASRQEAAARVIDRIEAEAAEAAVRDDAAGSVDTEESQETPRPPLEFPREF